MKLISHSSIVFLSVATQVAWAQDEPFNDDGPFDDSNPGEINFNPEEGEFDDSNPNGGNDPNAECQPDSCNYGGACYELPDTVSEANAPPGHRHYCLCFNGFYGRFCEHEDACRQPDACNWPGTQHCTSRYGGGGGAMYPDGTANGFETSWHTNSIATCHCKHFSDLHYSGDKCATEQHLKTSCGSGDVHYTSFDGDNFDNQGWCEYIMATNSKYCGQTLPPAGHVGRWDWEGTQLKAFSPALFEPMNPNDNFWQVVIDQTPIDHPNYGYTRDVSVIKQTLVQYRPKERTDGLDPITLQLRCERIITNRGGEGLWWPSVWEDETNGAGGHFRDLNGGQPSAWGNPWNWNGYFKHVQNKLVIAGNDLYVGVRDDLSSTPDHYIPSDFDAKITCNLDETCVSVFEGTENLCGLAGNANNQRDIAEHGFTNRWSPASYDDWTEIAYLWPNQLKCPHEGTYGRWEPNANTVHGNRKKRELPAGCNQAYANQVCGKLNNYPNCGIDTTAFVDRCKFDYCSAPEMSDTWVCDQVASYVNQCNALSDTSQHITSWRTAEFCPRPCPAHATYNDCAKRSCQPVYGGPGTTNHCTIDQALCDADTQCVGMCECHHGYVFKNGECIEASCPDMYPNECTASSCSGHGECEMLPARLNVRAGYRSYCRSCDDGWYGSNCEIQDPCDAANPCDPSGTLRCENRGRKGAGIAYPDFPIYWTTLRVAECVCKSGPTFYYSGDDCSTRHNLKQACGSGDVHYTTYDGNAFDNQGWCEYVFTSNGKICNNVSPPSSQASPWGGRMAAGSPELYEANNHGENFFQVINEHVPIDRPLDRDYLRDISVMKQTRVMYKPFERTDGLEPGLMQFLCERQPTAPRGRTGLWWPWVRQTNNVGVDYWMPLNGGMASAWGNPWNGPVYQNFHAIPQIKVLLRGYDLFLGVNDDLSDVPYMYHPTSYDIKVTCAPEICVSVFENQHDTLCGIAGNANGVNDFHENDFQDRNRRSDGTFQRFDDWNEIAFLWPNQSKCPYEGSYGRFEPSDQTIHGARKKRQTVSCDATQEQQDLCLKINDHTNCNVPKANRVAFCQFDVCAAPDMTDDWVCDTMADYVRECNLQSDTSEHITSWRTQTFCPMTCAANEVYRSCTKQACERFDNCNFDEAACAASTECVERCVCRDGFMRNSDGDCVVDTCTVDTDSFVVDSVFDLMEAVGGADNRNNIENHGCFCANLEDHKVHGIMADDVDRICKNNMACKQCNVASGDSYTVNKSGSDFTCDDQANSEGGQVRCQCDLQTVTNILNNMGGFTQQSCVEKTTPGNGGDFQCCGQGFKQMMFNANKFSCSVDNGEPSIQNTSTGAVQNYI